MNSLVVKLQSYLYLYILAIRTEESGTELNTNLCFIDFYLIFAVLEIFSNLILDKFKTKINLLK